MSFTGYEPMKLVSGWYRIAWLPGKKSHKRNCYWNVQELTSGFSESLRVATQGAKQSIVIEMLIYFNEVTQFSHHSLIRIISWCAYLILAIFKIKTLFSETPPNLFPEYFLNHIWVQSIHGIISIFHVLIDCFTFIYKQA